MKVLILSDLHISARYLAEKFYLEKQKRIFEFQFSSILKDVDLILISGDVVESSIMKYKECNPLDSLYYLFEKPIIFCLGNHEFAYQSHPNVIKYWSQFEHSEVHCLDIKGHVTMDKWNFVGNVLWYDFTLNNCHQLMQGEILDGWLDATIEDFDPLKECENCKQQIYSNLSKDKTNILITHMVPHIELNTFSIEQPTSPYNAYSGCNRFILDCQDKGFNIEYAICGHTHRKECKEIWNIKCINIGNDYFHRTNCYKYMTIDI
jgi:predicted phosphodiesterase